MDRWVILLVAPQIDAEASRLPEESMKHEAIKSAVDKFRKPYDHYLESFMVVAFAGGCITALHFWIAPISMLTMFFIVVFSSLLGDYAGRAVYLLRDREKIHLSIRRYLNDHGISTCLKCGYDLRYSDSARCPECGGASST